MGSSSLDSMRVAAVVFLAVSGTALTKTVPLEDRQLPDLAALTGLLGLLSGGGATGADPLSTLLSLLGNNGATGGIGDLFGGATGSSSTPPPDQGKGGKGKGKGKGGKGDLLSGLLAGRSLGEDRQLDALTGLLA